MIGLVPTRAGGALARAWASAASRCSSRSASRGRRCFAVGALLINDAGTAGPLIAGNSAFGSLLGGLLLAVAGLAHPWLCLKAPAKSAAFCACSSAGSWCSPAATGGTGSRCRGAGPARARRPRLLRSAASKHGSRREHGCARCRRGATAAAARAAGTVGAARTGARQPRPARAAPLAAGRLRPSPPGALPGRTALRPPQRPRSRAQRLTPAPAAPAPPRREWHAPAPLPGNSTSPRHRARPTRQPGRAPNATSPRRGCRALQAGERTANPSSRAPPRAHRTARGSTAATLPDPSRSRRPKANVTSPVRSAGNSTGGGSETHGAGRESRSTASEPPTTARYTPLTRQANAHQRPAGRGRGGTGSRP